MKLDLISYLSTFDATKVTHTDIYSCDRLHASMIASEYLEYLLAPDSGNQVEELGDMCWYWALGWIAEVGKYENSPITLPLAVVDVGLTQSVSDYLDCIKRKCFYRKDDRDRVLILTKLWSAINGEIARQEFDIGKILFLNIKKLQEVRYPAGFDAAMAVARNLEAERLVFYAE